MNYIKSLRVNELNEIIEFIIYSNFYEKPRRTQYSSRLI